MHPDAPYFSILLCLMPDDFTCQVEVLPLLNGLMICLLLLLVNLLSCIALQCNLRY
jgi:hypothetical protein